MAQDYVVSNEKSDIGLIAMHKSVFEAITKISIDDIDNAIALSNTFYSKPIQINIVKNKLNVAADVRVKNGANVEATCALIQNKIYENILLMTGFKAHHVEVNVIGFDF